MPIAPGKKGISLPVQLFGLPPTNDALRSGLNDPSERSFYYRIICPVIALGEKAFLPLGKKLKNGFQRVQNLL